MLERTINESIRELTVTEIEAVSGAQDGPCPGSKCTPPNDPPPPPPVGVGVVLAGIGAAGG